LSTEVGQQHVLLRIVVRVGGEMLLTEYVMIAVCVPIEYTETVRIAMCEAGAGTVDDGRYDRVAYVTRCVCKYRVLDKTRDNAGAAGEEREDEENRIEAICRRERIEAVIKAIVSAHPYETPAITIYPTLTGEYKYWEG
jgi:hypothetical protein